MSLKSLMIHEVDIYKPVITLDATSLRATHAYELLASSLKCRVEVVTGQDINSALGNFAEYKYMTMFEANAPIVDGYVATYNDVEYIIKNTRRDNNRERHNFIVCNFEERKE